MQTTASSGYMFAFNLLGVWSLVWGRGGGGGGGWWVEAQNLELPVYKVAEKR